MHTEEKNHNVFCSLPLHANEWQINTFSKHIKIDDRTRKKRYDAKHQCQAKMRNMQNKESNSAWNMHNRQKPSLNERKKNKKKEIAHIQRRHRQENINIRISTCAVHHIHSVIKLMARHLSCVRETTIVVVACWLNAIQNCICSVIRPVQISWFRAVCCRSFLLFPFNQMNRLGNPNKHIWSEDMWLAASESETKKQNIAVTKKKQPNILWNNKNCCRSKEKCEITKLLLNIDRTNLKNIAVDCIVIGSIVLVNLKPDSHKTIAQRCHQMNGQNTKRQMGKQERKVSKNRTFIHLYGYIPMRSKQRTLRFGQQSKYKSSTKNKKKTYRRRKPNHRLKAIFLRHVRFWTTKEMTKWKFHSHLLCIVQLALHFSLHRLFSIPAFRFYLSSRFLSIPLFNRFIHIIRLNLSFVIVFFCGYKIWFFFNFTILFFVVRCFCFIFFRVHINSLTYFPFGHFHA